MDQTLPPSPARRVSPIETVFVRNVPPFSNRRPKLVLPILLLGLTFITTLVAGFLQNLLFVSNSAGEVSSGLTSVMSNPLELLSGLPYAVTILAILLAHETGHYLACRYYRIDATLPHLIPAPPFIVLFGTLGAVIKIKSMFRDCRQLFDVGIAGPLAGFVVVVPALILGLRLSTQIEAADLTAGRLEFGEPLLFRIFAELFFSGDTSLINLHPIGWAAWFGMLATSLNLLPVGQLDGGHIVYSIFGRKKHRVASITTFIGLVVLSFASWPMLGYLLFAVILLVLRFRHPPPYIDLPGLDRNRRTVALIGLAVFVLTFIPIPVQLIGDF